MTSTLMIIISSGIAFGMAVVALGVATLAYAKMVGMEKSTHKIQWMPVPTPDAPSAVNDLPTREFGDGNEIQDFPKGKAPTRPLTIKEQMQKHMYPDDEDNEHT